jgi:hypothetical protein
MHKIADEILAISIKKKTELNHLQDTRDILFLPLTDQLKLFNYGLDLNGWLKV